MEGTVDRWQAFEDVREWLAAAGFRVADRPTLDVPRKERELACALIEEEAREFRDAVEASDLIEIADAIADLIWVTLEAAATFGIPVEPVFEEVRRSNWTKIETPERVVNSAGKLVGGRGFSPPELLPVLAAHAASEEGVAEWKTKAPAKAVRPVRLHASPTRAVSGERAAARRHRRGGDARC